MAKKKTMKKHVVAAQPVPMAHDDMCACGSCETSCGSWGLTLLRLVVGALFLLHGIQKFMNLSGPSGFFTQLGLPAWLATVVAAVEVLGGIALILGVWTYWGGTALAVVMLGALAFSHLGWAGALGWIAVVLGTIALFSLCSRFARVATWVAAVVIVVLVAVALWGQGLTFKADLERDLVLLAATLVLAWEGPGRFSIHSKCNCCC